MPLFLFHKSIGTTNIVKNWRKIAKIDYRLEPASSKGLTVQKQHQMIGVRKYSIWNLKQLIFEIWRQFYLNCQNRWIFSYLTLFYIKCPKIDLQYKNLNLCKIYLGFYNKWCKNTNVKRSIQLIQSYLFDWILLKSFYFKPIDVTNCTTHWRR